MQSQSLEINCDKYTILHISFPLKQLVFVESIHNPFLAITLFQSLYFSYSPRSDIANALSAMATILPPTNAPSIK